MVQKWMTESDREMSMSAWLQYKKADRDYLVTLKCSMCIQFNEKLQGMHNYNPAFVVSSKNLRASSYKDHVVATCTSNQCFFQSSRDVTEYALIASDLHNLDGDTALKVK